MSSLCCSQGFSTFYSFLLLLFLVAAYEYVSFCFVFICAAGVSQLAVLCARYCEQNVFCVSPSYFLCLFLLSAGVSVQKKMRHCGLLHVCVHMCERVVVFPFTWQRGRKWWCDGQAGGERVTKLPRTLCVVRKLNAVDVDRLRLFGVFRFWPFHQTRSYSSGSLSLHANYFTQRWTHRTTMEAVSGQQLTLGSISICLLRFQEAVFTACRGSKLKDDAAPPEHSSGKRPQAGWKDIGGIKTQIWYNVVTFTINTWPLISMHIYSTWLIGLQQ